MSDSTILRQSCTVGTLLLSRRVSLCLVTITLPKFFKKLYNIPNISSPKLVYIM